jgi:hypothetical protein
LEAPAWNRTRASFSRSRVRRQLPLRHLHHLPEVGHPVVGLGHAEEDLAPHVLGAEAGHLLAGVGGGDGGPEVRRDERLLHVHLGAELVLLLDDDR